METAFAAFTAFLVAAGPVSVGVTKVVDTIRNALDPSGKFPKVVWNLAAFGIGVGFCVGWGVNLFAALLAAVPALKASTALAGTAGQILTGIAVGGMAGFWHEKMAADSARSKGVVTDRMR